MLISIKPNKLKSYLWHLGPYLYFYNNSGDEVNQKIVYKMREMAYKYSKIVVLEIDWNVKLLFDHNFNTDIINHVFVYFKGKLKEIFKNPNENAIEEIFEKAIYFFNENMEIKSKNVGIRNKYDFSKIINYDKKNLDRIKKNYINNECKRKYLLNNRIRLTDKTTFYNNLATKISPTLKYKNMLNSYKNDLKNIDLDFLHNNHLFNLSENILTSESWFNDVKINDLPKNILLDGSSNVKIQNSCDSKIIESYKNSDTDAPCIQYEPQKNLNFLNHKIEKSSNVSKNAICQDNIFINKIINKNNKIITLHFTKMITKNRKPQDLKNNKYTFEINTNSQQNQDDLLRKKCLSHLSDHNYCYFYQ